MSYQQLIYTSHGPGLRFPDLMDIIAKAKPRNQVAGISGLLVFGDETFLQLIEGPSRSVNDLYHARIVRDERHRDIHLINYGSCSDRLFPDWSMGLASVNDDTRMLLQQTDGSEQFKPHRWTCDQAIGFLRQRGAMRRDLILN